MSEQMTSAEFDECYERYGKPLENDHRGEFVAITQDGRVIVGKNDIGVVDRAIEEFGSGNFILCRVGDKTVGKIRRAQCTLATNTRTST
jgi:hypothetical protein